MLSGVLKETKQAPHVKSQKDFKGCPNLSMLSGVNGGQNYLLLTMDMAKVGGTLLVVKVSTFMLGLKIGYGLGYGKWVALYRF